MVAGRLFIVAWGIFIVVVYGIFVEDGKSLVVAYGIFSFWYVGSLLWYVGSLLQHVGFFFFGSMTDLFNCDMWDSSVGTCKVFLVAECEIFIVVVCGTFEL